MRKSKLVGPALFCLVTLLLCSPPVFAADTPQPTPIRQTPIAFGAGRVTQSLEAPVWGLHQANPPRRIPKPSTSPTTDHVIHSSAPYSAEFSLIYHVLGIGNGFPNYSVPDAPPDTTLAVGVSEVVQFVNVSYADFDKATGAIVPLNGQDSTPGNTIWHNLIPGTLCANNNDGDPIIKFDRAAQRWVIAQNVFASPYAVCVAVSQTATFADNLWYAYQFPAVNSGFPDYPKWGVWSSGGASDGYFQTWNNFGPGGSGFVGPVICGYDRAKMLVGDSSAEQICFQLSSTSQVPQDSLLPADRDSPTPPPANEDEFFIGSLGDVDNSHLSLYSMHINSWSPANATMTGNGNTQLLSIASFTPACNGNYGGPCVPQCNTTDMLDSLGDRLMYRFAHWEDRPPSNATATPPLPAPVQHWLVNHDVTGDSGQNAVRWYEITANLRTVPVTSLNVFQQGTYEGSPTDANARWMGSLTRDNTGDILVGYSESSSSLCPSIAAAGRKYTDSLGTLSAEIFSVIGAGGQPDTSNRWGDYSTMEIDPIDNCTFFYTNEYYMLTQRFDWSTDISSWKFPNCH
jgi:hypothetical protein